jgi:hypothetical protein
VEQLRLELVLRRARAREQRGRVVRLARDLRRRAHDPELDLRLAQPHLVHEVVRRDDLRRRVHAAAHARAHVAERGRDPIVELGVAPEGVEQARAVLDQRRQPRRELADRVRLVRAEDRDRALDPRPAAVPGLEQRIARLHEEREAVAREDRERLGLLEAGQIQQVRVLAEHVVGVVRADARLRAGHERDALPELALEAAAPRGEFGARYGLVDCQRTSRKERARGYQAAAARAPFPNLLHTSCVSAARS